MLLKWARWLEVTRYSNQLIKTEKPKKDWKFNILRISEDLSLSHTQNQLFLFFVRLRLFMWQLQLKTTHQGDIELVAFISWIWSWFLLSSNCATCSPTCCTENSGTFLAFLFCTKNDWSFLDSRFLATGSKWYRFKCCSTRCFFILSRLMSKHRIKGLPSSWVILSHEHIRTPVSLPSGYKTACNLGTGMLWSVQNCFTYSL